MKQMFYWKVKNYIRSQQLCRSSDRLIVGVSGGADSVALLRLLLQMGYSVEAAHCNFQLRGEESERDERFVEELCRVLHVRLHVKRFDTNSYAVEKKVSIEMAARDLRYAWFRELLKERGAAAIAVAHHQEDNAETVLLNLLRGTGLSGLCGMQSRNGDVIRPLLETSREDIENYLSYLKQDFVTDSTNLEAQCYRNKIRLNIIPAMQSINPSVVASIVETAHHLKDVRSMVDKSLQEAERRCKLKLDSGTSLSMGCKVNIHQLQCEDAPRLLLYYILSPYGFNSTQIGEIYASLSGEAGKLFESSKGWTLLKDRSFLLIRSAIKDESEVDRLLLLDVPSVHSPLDIEKEGVSFHVERLVMTDCFVIPHKKSYACLDAGKLPSALYIRRWRQGDRFTPFGMKGTKLLSDYMTDCKFSLFQKEEQMVLVDGNDRIVWVVGERIDDNYKIDGHTKEVLQLSVS